MASWDFSLVDSRVEVNAEADKLVGNRGGHCWARITEIFQIRKSVLTDLTIPYWKCGY